MSDMQCAVGLLRDHLHQEQQRTTVEVQPRPSSDIRAHVTLYQATNIGVFKAYKVALNVGHPLDAKLLNSFIAFQHLCTSMHDTPSPPSTHPTNRSVRERV